PDVGPLPIQVRKPDRARTGNLRPPSARPKLQGNCLQIENQRKDGLGAPLQHHAENAAPGPSRHYPGSALRRNNLPGRSTARPALEEPETRPAPSTDRLGRRQLA